MSKRMKFLAMSIAFIIVEIATTGVVIAALWQEDYHKAIFYLLLFSMYSGAAKWIRAYGKSILREERKMNDGHNGEA